MERVLSAEEQASRALRQRLGAGELLGSLPMGIYCCDRDGVIRFFNPRAADLWGRAPELGDTAQRFCGAYKLFLSDGRALPHNETPMAAVLRTGVAERDQTIVIERPDGTQVTALVNIDPLFGDDGSLIGAVNCFQDITELGRAQKEVRRAEERVRESEQRLRDLLEALPLAVYTTDAKGRITFYNQAAVDMAGRRPELGTDKWCVSWRLYWPDGMPLPHDQCPMAMPLKEGRPITGAKAILERPDGRRVPFLPFPAPLRDGAGELTGAINVLVDIADREQADVTAARLATIVASSDDAIVSKTLEGRITSWNAGAERIFGYAAEEMIGQPITRIIPPELHDEEDEILARLRRGERIDHFDTVRVTKDGRRVHISLTVSPLRDGSGRIVGASKVARDISDRKWAEERQQLLVSELNHRVKNTLGIVQAVAQQSLRRAKSPADFADAFTGRLQALARAHSLLSEFTWAGVDLSSLVKDQLLLGSADDPRISWSGPAITLKPQPALHMALVLHELATNARKYGALSTPNGRLSASWSIETNGGRLLHLRWAETGCPRTLEPAQPGFGTILIEQIVKPGGEAHMTCEAHAITWDIKLPLPSSAVLNTDKALLSRNVPNPDMHTEKDIDALRGKRLLIVEDEPLIALELSQSLAEVGIEVVKVARTVAEAQRAIAELDCDAAMVDANLAGQQADDVAVALARRNVPFAFVSGYGREALPAAFRSRILIPKPFTAEQVLDVVSELIPQNSALDIMRLAYVNSN